MRRKLVECTVHCNYVSIPRMNEEELNSWNALPKFVIWTMWTLGVQNNGTVPQQVAMFVPAVSFLNCSINRNWQLSISFLSVPQCICPVGPWVYRSVVGQWSMIIHGSDVASSSLPRFDILSSPFFRKCMEGRFREATFGPNFDRFLGSSKGSKSAR